MRPTMKPILKQGAALTVLFLGLASASVAEADDAWLKSAGLGPHAPAQQDWAAIEKAPAPKARW